MKTVYLQLLLVAIISLGISGVAVAEVAVIVNPESGITKLSKSQIKRLFLGKSRKLPNGARAVPVNQEEGSPVREAFNQRVLQKNERQIQAYWSKKIFSGKAQALRELSNDAAVKAFVAEHRNAVGFIDGQAIDNSVTVVFTMP